MFTIIVFSPMRSKIVSVDGMKVCSDIGCSLLQRGGLNQKTPLDSSGVLIESLVSEKLGGAAWSSGTGTTTSTASRCCAFGGWSVCRIGGDVSGCAGVFC
jgi:hypothetical protein